MTTKANTLSLLDALPISPDSGGLGLFGMSERAGYLGGRVDVESTPGGGTRVRAEIPLPHPSAG